MKVTLDLPDNTDLLILTVLVDEFLRTAVKTRTQQVHDGDEIIIVIPQEGETG